MTFNRNSTCMKSVLFAIATLAVVGSACAQQNGPGPGARGEREREWWMGPGPMMGPGMMGRGDWDRACGPAVAGLGQWRIAQLEQELKLTDMQRAKLDDLKSASMKAAEVMRSACSVDRPTTMIGRMDAMEKRMDAMLQAIRTIRPPLEAFYAALDDEQKARIDGNRGRGRFWRWMHWG
jgi:hypothetical protein